MKSAVGVEVPQCLSTPRDKAEPGLYLCLFHGRKPGEVLNDWGSNGPMIGPLKFVHTTYGHHIKLEFEDLADHHKYFPDTEAVNVAGKEGTTLIWAGPNAELFVNRSYDHSTGECVQYDGIFYGDWTVCVVKP